MECIDTGWIPGTQSHPMTPLPSWTGEIKEHIVVEITSGRSLTEYHCRQTAQLGEINYIYFQSNKTRILRDKHKPKTPSAHFFLLSGFDLTHNFSLLTLSKWHREIGNRGHQTSLLLLPPHTLCLLNVWSFSRETAVWQQSFSQAAPLHELL